MPQFLYALYTTQALRQNTGLLFLGAVCVIVFWQFFRRRAIYFNYGRASSFWLLALFGFSYVLLGERTVRALFYYVVCPLVAFAAGWITVEAAKQPAQRIIKYTVYGMLAGYAVHAFLNWNVNIGQARGALIDFFTGNIRAATGSGIINTFIFSLITYLLVLEKNIKLKILSVIVFLISLRYAFLLGSRTQFIILLLVSVSFGGVYLYEKYGKSAVLRFGLVLGVLGGIGMVVYHFNVLGLHTYVDHSNLMARYADVYGLQDADQYRWTSIFRGVRLLLHHPFGGLQAVGYYHNFWLDIGRIAGILPTGLMLLYSLIINWHLFLIFRSKKEAAWFRYLLFCVYLGVQLNFATEPILEGLLDFFLCFTVINGMVECYYYRVYLRSDLLPDRK